MSQKTPPIWITRFFRWFCREELCDAVEGDLLEVYQRKVTERGALKAQLWYAFSIFSFLQPFALKSRRISQRLISIDMIRNHLKIAYRNLVASKFFTLINVSGLAIGIAGFMVMAVFVHGEMSYDRFHSKADRIVRLAYEYSANNSREKVALTPFPMKPMLLEEFPGVERVVRFYKNGNEASTIRYEDQHFTEKNIVYADPEVFEVFDFELERGNATTALTGIKSIVMTAKIARKYFGNEDPIGKIIEFEADDQLQVTGILKELPSASHLQFEILMPVALQRNRWMRPGAGNNGYDFEQDWNWSGAWQYVLLESPETIASFEEKLFNEGKEYFGRPSDVEYHFKTQPITDIHLKSDMAKEFQVNGNLKQVYGFSMIALLILLIACINFVNLSTARSAKRAKEVGLRKVMGAIRRQLIGQFIAESVLIALLATALAVGLTEVMLPYFNQFMGKSLSIPYFQSLWVLPGLLAGALIVGLMAGIYPAFYITRFEAIKTLKGHTTTASRGSVRLRKGLVTSQFLIANLLIIGILVVQQQLDYIKSKDLGFEKDQVIVLTHGGKMEGYNVFRDAVKQLPGVAAVNQGYVAGTRDWTQTFEVDGESVEAGKNLGIKHVSWDFLEMFEMKLLAGRFFERGNWMDWKKTVLLNESAVKNFGWTHEGALGKRISYVGGNDNRTRFDCKVIGVVADAHLESLYRPVRPSVFKQASWGDVSLKLNTANPEQLRATLAEIETIWTGMVTKWPFEFEFLDETIAAQYLKEEKLGQTIQFFTLLAIFIASLGLFGLASYTVQQRRREIGIRKVLGATVTSILALVGSRFFALIGLSFLISIPLGYYLMGQWLQEFEYRVSMGPQTFILAGLVSMLIAVLAIGGQSLKAATSNPVKSLKHE